jgi:integrase
MELKPDKATGIFYIHWTERAPGATSSRSKRATTGTRNRKEAEVVLAGFILEGGRRKDGDMQICAALDDYWLDHAQKVESADRIFIIIRHLKAHFGETLVGDLDRTLMNRYYVARAGEGIAEGTIRREAATLVAAINHVVREKKLDKVLVPHIALPPEPPAKDRWLTQEEARRLREACNDLPIRLFVELALGTASRKRALETLTWFQVDMERRLIDLNPAGRRQTAKRRPRVPISDELYPWLAKARAAWPKSEYVLGDRLRIQDRFETVVRRAGLYNEDRARNVTPHTLRHTWATWACQAGVDLWQVAGVMGDTLVTVERKYAHHHPDYLRDAVNFKRREIEGDLSQHRNQ